MVSMCWNAPVSLIFALVGYACTGFLLYVGNKARKGEPTRWTKACSWHALFVGNIACVELMEFLIWISDPPDINEGTQDTCPLLNSIGTYGTFTFGFVNWMWIVALWAYMSSNDGNDKHTFQMYLVLGIVTSLAYIVKIVIGDHFQMGTDFWEEQSRWLYDPTVKVVTCSYQDPGKYQHLHWRFNMAAYSFLPSGYSWFTVGLMPLFFYKPRGTALVASVWGAATYAIPFAVLPASETMSMY